MHGVRLHALSVPERLLTHVVIAPEDRLPEALPAFAFIVHTFLCTIKAASLPLIPNHSTEGSAFQVALIPYAHIIIT